MNTVPTADSARPMGAMEKIPKPGRPPCCKMLLAMRNAGAPMIVMVVPSEAANDSGMSSFEAGMFSSREMSSMTGSMTAVVVTWCVNADSKATVGITTATMRV